MKNLKKLLALALALCLALSLCACGGSGDAPSNAPSGDPGATQSGGSTPSDAPDDTQSGSANDADGNGRADKVVYASTMSYPSLNPFLNPKTFTSAVYEPLGAYETYGDKFGGLLMESWEHPDDLTYIVKLKENITDSKGNKIDAEDVVFCYDKVRTVGEISRVSVIESVKAVDQYTVEFKWAATPVVGSFESIMTVVNIVDKDEYEATGDDMSSTPVGTGPYVVDSWTSGVTMTLKVNENYWAKDDIKFNRQKQNVDVIEIQTVSETSQLTMGLQTGTIHMTDAISSQDAPNFQEGGPFSSNHAVVETEAFAPKTLLVNTDPASKTSDPNLRQAIIRAIDNETIAAVVNGGSNHPTYGVGSSYNPDYDAEAFKSFLPGYDPDAAKEYLAKSNYPDGTTISLLLIDGGISNDVAEMVRNQLSQIGITVEVNAEIFPNWMAKKQDPANWDLIVSELSSSDYVTTIWQNAFGIRNGHNEIFSDDRDQQLMDLLAACTTEAGHTQESVNAFQKYVSEQAYAIPLLAQLQYNVYDTGLISEIVMSGEGCIIPQGFTYN